MNYFILKICISFCHLIHPAFCCQCVKIHYLLTLGLLFCTPLPKKLWHKLEESPLRWLTVPVLLAIFWGAVYCLFKGLNDPFLYFRF